MDKELHKSRTPKWSASLLPYTSPLAPRMCFGRLRVNDLPHLWVPHPPANEFLATACHHSATHRSPSLLLCSHTICNCGHGLRSLLLAFSSLACQGSSRVNIRPFRARVKKLPAVQPKHLSTTAGGEGGKEGGSSPLRPTLH